MKKLFYSGVAFTCIVCLCVSVNNIGKSKQFANDLSDLVLFKVESLAQVEKDDDLKYDKKYSDCYFSATIDSEGYGWLFGENIGYIGKGGRYQQRFEDAAYKCELSDDGEYLECQDYSCEDYEKDASK